MFARYIEFYDYVIRLAYQSNTLALDKGLTKINFLILYPYLGLLKGFSAVNIIFRLFAFMTISLLELKFYRCVS